MRRSSILAIALLVILLPASGGEVKDTADLVRKTKITIAKAIEEALAVSPGTAVSARLVKGDDGPVWRVVVLRGEELSDVRVDAASAKATLGSTWKDESEAERARGSRAGD
jgi:uncharacterized membrane protein YkoI